MVYLLAAVLLVGSWFLPWWWIIVPGAVAGYYSSSSWGGFAKAFVATAAVWLVIAYFFDFHAHGLVSARIGGLFHLPFAGLSFVVTAVLGGLACGLSALSGFYFKRLSC